MAYRLRPSIVALPVLLALAAPAAAADPEPEETPSELMADAMSQMVRALELFVKSIPQYEKPEITENGDIIIRRKRPGAEPDVPKSPHRLPDPTDPDDPDKGRAI
jgi:hypothetical protein